MLGGYHRGEAEWRDPVLTTTFAAMNDILLDVYTDFV